MTIAFSTTNDENVMSWGKESIPFAVSPSIGLP